MLVTGRVHGALQARRDEFVLADGRARQERGKCAELFHRLSGMNQAEVEARLGGVEWPGARPTAELTQHGLRVPFEKNWGDIQAARGWALETLRGVRTAAVDGSQIAASKEFATPLSLIQVAWFVNPHDPDVPYTKDVHNEVLRPGDQGSDAGEYVFTESRVNQRRYVLEMETAARLMAEARSSRKSLVFHDGSLVLSFTDRMSPDNRDVYLNALFACLDASGKYRVPLAGYVDLSLASDLAGMLSAVFDIPRPMSTDGEVLASQLGPLDRTAAFVCARGDILPRYARPDHDYSAEICFVYLQTGNSRPPARIDFPRWVLDSGLLDAMIDVIRAEVIVGGGYPYALETADAAAVLTVEDRMQFYGMWQRFASDAGLEISLPGKTSSKVRRR